MRSVIRRHATLLLSLMIMYLSTGVAQISITYFAARLVQGVSNNAYNADFLFAVSAAFIVKILLVIATNALHILTEEALRFDLLVRVTTASSSSSDRSYFVTLADHDAKELSNAIPVAPRTLSDLLILTFFFIFFTMQNVLIGFLLLCFMLVTMLYGMLLKDKIIAHYSRYLGCLEDYKSKFLAALSHEASSHVMYINESLKKSEKMSFQYEKFSLLSKFLFEFVASMSVVLVVFGSLRYGSDAVTKDLVMNIGYISLFIMISGAALDGIRTMMQCRIFWRRMSSAGVDRC